jgi:hypothetical protein
VQKRWLALGCLLAIGLFSVTAGLTLAQRGEGGTVERPVHNIRYEPASAPSAISEAQAIQAAKAQVSPAIASQAKQITARYVLFSNDDYHIRDAAGQSKLAFERIPAWVVTFEGVTFRTPGDVRMAGRTGKPRAHSEVNVVIDATTGKSMELFAYR